MGRRDNPRNSRKEQVELQTPGAEPNMRTEWRDDGTAASNGRWRLPSAV